MADEMVSSMVCGFIELIINNVLRALGYSEIKIKNLEKIIAWSLIFILLAGLFYITFKYG